MVEIKKFEHIIGLTLEEAKQAVGKDFTIRPIKIDNNYLMCTQDLKINRINVCLTDKVISEVKNLG